MVAVAATFMLVRDLITFDNFWLSYHKMTSKSSVLVNFVSPSIFQHIEECTEYEAAVGILRMLFVTEISE